MKRMDRCGGRVIYESCHLGRLDASESRGNKGRREGIKQKQDFDLWVRITDDSMKAERQIDRWTDGR